MTQSLAPALNSAYREFASGNLPGAAAKCEQLRQLNAAHPDVLHLSSLVARAQGNLGQAKDFIESALQLVPERHDLLHTQAQILLSECKYSDAIQVLRRCLMQKPDFAEAYNTLGQAYHLQGDLADAAEQYQAALRVRPTMAQAHANLGAVFCLMADWGRAISHLSVAANLSPNSHQHKTQLGMCYVRACEYEKAIEQFDKALRLSTDSVLALMGMGIALQNARRFAESGQYYVRALEQAPESAELFFNIGCLLKDADLTNPLRAALTKLAMAEDATASGAGEPRPPLRISSQDELEEWCYRAALRLDPTMREAHANLSIRLLASGNFKEGWRESVWRQSVPHHPMGPSPTDPASKGLVLRELGGKEVVLHGEQGLGDIIFFLRFARKLKEVGMRISFCGDSRLHSILSRSGYFEMLYAPSSDLPSNCEHILVGDLPLLCECTDVTDIPCPISLCPMASHTEQVKGLLRDLGPPPYCGVSWRAGLQPKAARKTGLFKEIPLDQLSIALKDFPGTLVSVQRNPRPGENDAFQSLLERPVHDLSAMNEQLEEVLALMAVLDNYVGVSNTNTHLRACVGKASYVLVPHPAEWRWGQSGDRSVWYPNSRLFRETASDGWRNAICALRTDLLSITMGN